MPRYAAFLRGVSPMNAKMPDLKQAFEVAGFGDVQTVLSSGNVLFEAPRRASHSVLERRAEDAMQRELGRTFLTIVRPFDALRELIEIDPYAPFHLPPEAKRVVTFLRAEPNPTASLPLEVDGACILCVHGREAFSAYLPSPQGAVFMTLIEKTFGTAATTRTWETVRKVAAR